MRRFIYLLAIPVFSVVAWAGRMDTGNGDYGLLPAACSGASTNCSSLFGGQLLEQDFLDATHSGGSNFRIYDFEINNINLTNFSLTLASTQNFSSLGNFTYGSFICAGGTPSNVQCWSGGDPLSFAPDPGVIDPTKSVTFQIHVPSTAVNANGLVFYAVVAAGGAPVTAAIAAGTPEPASFILLGFALAALALRKRFTADGGLL
jgi:hypothetical protein